MAAIPGIEGVHMVGSIGLPTVDDVFETCGGALGERLRRISDGEVGGRRHWVGWQWPLLQSMPFLERSDELTPGGNVRARLATGHDAGEVWFGELGYSREARASYADFVRARDAGVLPPDIRFMVALPTPYAVIGVQLEATAVPVCYEPYKAALLDEVARICDAIPHHDLSVQWDLCPEMLIWDSDVDYEPWRLPGDPARGILAGVGEMTASVPAAVEVGYHLCYAESDEFRPRDARAMVTFANEILQIADRSVAWLHFPVPVDRDDEAFFEPFGELDRPSETKLYLGLVHLADGVEGVERRARAARPLDRFGISTECGIARAYSPKQVEKLLSIHAAAAAVP